MTAVRAAGAAGVTATDATTWATVIEAVPLTPLAVAVMVALPLVTAVTTPVAASTVATAGADDVHANWMPLRVLFEASLATAPRACVPPIFASVTGVGVTVMEAGVTVTVTLTEPDLPEVLAVMLAVPIPTAVTRPLALTVATPDALDVHVMMAVTALPAELRAVACSCDVIPMAVSMTGPVGVTVTVATALLGVGVGVSVGEAVSLHSAANRPPARITAPRARMGEYNPDLGRRRRSVIWRLSGAEGRN